MTLEDDILAALAIHPGLTDRELADLLRGSSVARQAVNGECRLLRNQHKLRRVKRSDGLLGNYLIDPNAPVQAGDLWTEAEIKAAVESYLGLLALQQRGEATNKAAVNRKLRNGPLAGRSSSSVEQRMQNITAVLLQLEQPTLHGYPPLENVGKLNWRRIEAAVASMLDGLPDVLHDLPDVDVPPVGNEHPALKTGAKNAYERDQRVVAWVLKRAGGYCEGCQHPAPFVTARGRPFLEVHHLTHLAAKGSDTPANAVALCPNCHRKIHYASLDAVRQFEQMLMDYLGEIENTNHG